MSLANNKRNIFTTLGAYTSLREERTSPDSTNSFSSVNNKKEIIPFLLDILKVVVGSTALIDLTGELFSNFLDDAEPQSKTVLKRQTIQFNANETLPSDFVNDGYDVPVKDIDVFNKLKTNPNSAIGSLLYGGVGDTFDKKAYDAINAPDTEVTYNNLLIKYNSTTDSFNFKPVAGGVTIGDWTNDFIDNTTILERKEFMSTVMDSIYGTITSQQNKTLEKIIEEEEIRKILENLIDDEDRFELTQEELLNVSMKAKGLSEGVVYYDLGCGMMAVDLPLSGMTDLIENISGSTNPNQISNEILKSFYDSIEPIDEDDVTGQENERTIKDGFFTRLIKTISVVLGTMITTSPQVRAIKAISNAFGNDGDTKISSPREDLKENKVFIKCLIKELIKLFNQFIFNLIVAALMGLLRPIIRRIVREKINQYISILKSLISSKL